MRKFLASLLLIGLVAGCAPRVSYPVFPLPNEHVATVLDDVSEQDSQVREWLNRLLDLCQQFGICAKE